MGWHPFGDRRWGPLLRYPPETARNPILGPIPALNTGGGPNNQLSAGGRIRVGYSDSTVGTYTLDALASYGVPIDRSDVAWGKPMAKAWDAFHRDLQPYVLTVDSTGESVQFGYTPGTTTNSEHFVGGGTELMVWVGAAVPTGKMRC